ncbi:c-type cytochrome [Flavobacteriaceae sp. LMIT009]
MKINKLFSALFFISISLVSCKQKEYEEPFVSLERYHIEEGFELSVAASEPFIEAPVSISFDNQGRIWTVEMKGYMRNLEDTDSEMPNGTISILEDWDDDGITDHVKVFLDSLVLPRAIAHVYDGLLYAEPPNLWFVDIENDKPVNPVLVDSLYSDGGNVEHQPNGLMMNIDNWIYNANSNFKYQRKNGKWIKEPTTYRGQWGISKDNFGRIYYNNNSTQIVGDFVFPNTIINNQYYKPKKAVSKSLTPNQRVYPLHRTYVNRGYQKGVLDSDSLLINVTSACGPLVYRGDQFPDEYLQNAFVCAPEANLIKRNILSFDVDSIAATQAWEGKEFIASTEQGFRPVNLFDGPDGNMYIADMHRGIIQHKAFLTPYLQKLLAEHKVDTIIGMGRILRASKANYMKSEIPLVEEMSISELVKSLQSSNGWLRDRAQQRLVLLNNSKSAKLLKELSLNNENNIAVIHALHTLNGIDALEFEQLLNIVSNTTSSEVIAHCLMLLRDFAASENVSKMQSVLLDVKSKNDAEVDLYIAMTTGSWAKMSNDTFFPILKELSEKYVDRRIFQEAIISSLGSLEKEYQAFLATNYAITEGSLFEAILNETLVNIDNDKKNTIYVQRKTGTDGRTAGYNIYRVTCAACHGFNGEGIDAIAPPLMGSDYVTGPSERLAAIILHGISGPIHVNGELYNFNAPMPGLGNNPEISDEDIVAIIEYLNNAFPGAKDRVNIEKVKELRDKKPKSGLMYTEAELKELFK